MLIDPYAKAVMGRRKFGELGPVCNRLRPTQRPYAASVQAVASITCWVWCSIRWVAEGWHRPFRYRLMISAVVPRVIAAPGLRRQDIPYSSNGTLGVARTWPQAAGALPRAISDFDWQGDAPLRLPMEDLVIYEMHVRGFTQHESSGVSAPGGRVLASSESGVACASCAVVMQARTTAAPQMTTKSSDLPGWNLVACLPA